MKIAVITDHIPSKFAHSVNTIKIAQGLFKLGHDVEVLVIRRFKEEINNLKTYNVHYRYGLNKKVKIIYFRDYSLNYFRELRYIGAIFTQLMTFLERLFHNTTYFLDPEKRISFYCKKKSFDFAFYRRAINSLYYNILNHIPSVYDIHGIWEPKLKYLPKLIHNKNFKGILTINDTLKKLLIKRGFLKEKIRVMDNSVDITIYEKIKASKTIIRKKIKFPLNKKIVLYAGSLFRDRDIEIILKSANILNESFVFYFLGGDKKEIKYWKNFISKKKLNEKKIKFFGLLSRELLPYYFKAADVLIATFSANILTKDIMSPVKLIEYMASRTPIIATKIGRVIDICNNDECLFINVNDVKDLCDKLNFITENIEFSEKMTRNAFNKAKRYTLTKRCEKIIDLIKK